jgi:transcriptional regulator with XRE-family HTH domain
MEDIGRKIRKFRRDRGWTLEDLARQTDLSPGFLSQIEREQSYPSLSSLKAIADALEIPLSSFFILPVNTSIVARAHERRTFMIEGSEVSYSSLSGPIDGKRLEPLIVELPPHYEGPPAFTHEGEEFGYVLEGQLTIVIQNQEYHLRPGDSIHFLSQAPHTWKNCHAEPVKAIWVVTPRLISTGGGDHEP